MEKKNMEKIINHKEINKQEKTRQRINKKVEIKAKTYGKSNKHTNGLKVLCGY
ncbi:hypothetical protein IY804_00555 [Campylobacter volucris]|uniref:hypothetical protein n=1 Tax=Campylobacter volucris TaxID=1031542 RepID=UPI0018A0D6FA|nr:hypothetical protein [Campylobacter volucris]MBF7046580.1 hypothetical protein [Campylobacter volucris]